MEPMKPTGLTIQITESCSVFLPEAPTKAKSPGSPKATGAMRRSRKRQAPASLKSWAGYEAPMPSSKMT